MKNTLLFLGIIVLAICATFKSIGQSGTFTTIGGNGTTGLTSTSGPASMSSIYPWINNLTIDRNGTVYFFSQQSGYSLSKIDTSGSITRILGDSSYYLDPIAPEEWSLYEFYDMASDKHGNFYYLEFLSDNIYKIDTNGNASYVSTGSMLYQGEAKTIYIDTGDNIFYGTYNRIFKRSPAGVITVIAGTGTPGYNGDNIAATSAQISGAYSLTGDKKGNLYFVDRDNYRIRKIDRAGIISTIAGNGLYGSVAALDGAMSISLSIDPYDQIAVDNKSMVYFGNKKISPSGIISTQTFASEHQIYSPDDAGNFYFYYGDGYIRKFTPSTITPVHNSDVKIDTFCLGPRATATTELNDTAFKMISNFGDGTFDTTRLMPSLYSGGFCAIANHSYAAAGTYTIKNVIYHASAPVDSFTTSYSHLPCDVILLRPYYDINSDCAFNTTTEIASSLPVTVAIDSNGIPKDTVSITSGLYYTAYGNPGDIYTFNIISHADGILPSCPLSGSISDTFTLSGDHSREIDFGMNCSSLPGTDLAINSSHNTGRHTQRFTITANNNYCTATSGTLVVNISPKFSYHSALPLPTSISGNAITWDLATLSSVSTPSTIHLTLEVPGAWLTPGDTTHTTIKIISSSGDLDTSNNNLFLIDTVKSSFDPNYIAVAPQGNILNGTKLNYTIEFENDGNDTAHNIYVMDTLSDNVDPSSFEMVMATNPMNIAMFQAGGHTIVKFDFPNIKLLDSSHHNQCTGMLIYNINAKRGLPDYTDIFNHAGIFFDDNPVILTNTVQNVIRIPSISIAQLATICPGDTVHFIATTPNINNTHYKWFVNGLTAGTDKYEFASNSLSAGDIVNCQLWDGTGDSLLSISNNIGTAFLPLPDAGTITGTPTVCELATTTLSNTVTGGIWTSSSTDATIAGPVVTGVSAGSTIISYTATNSCSTATDTMLITINPLPQAGTITGAEMLCATTATTLTDAVTGGTWTSSSAAATVAGGVVNGVSAGSAVISYSVTNSCGTAVDTMTITVLPLADAGTITGTPVVCELATATLSNTVISGTWTSSSADATITGSVVTGVTAGSTIISYTVTNSCNTATDTMLITVNPLPVAGTITGATGVCVGTSITLSNSITGGLWAASTGDATVTGGTVTGVVAGNVVIFYSVTNTCGTASDTMMITVLPAADAGTITGATTICPGTTATLTGAVSGGIWISSTSSTATISASGIISGVATGTTTISYVIANSCGADTATTNITVSALPDAGTITGMDSVCPGLIITLNNTATGTWSSSDISTAIVSASGVVTGVSSGTVTIIYTSTNACGTDAATFVVVVRPDAMCEGGVNNTGTAANNLVLYPNPNDGTFAISGSLLGVSDDVKIEIVNMLGQVVYKNTVANNNGTINEEIQPASKLADGTYILRVHSGEMSKMFHFVIKS